MKKRLVISGTGCALADNLYTDIDFGASLFQKYLSKENADGGLSPGKLVFIEEFEKFSGQHLSEIITEITQGKAANSFNIGGPSIVALISASQLLTNQNVDINFYGAIGNDKVGDQIIKGLKSTQINFDNYKRFESHSPFTDVLSDPNFDGGKGERIFINNIGAAWNYQPQDLNEDFFKSDITVFGGTALVPNIHDNLTELLQKAKDNNCITIVNTVYDFRNEKNNPSEKWPLVKHDNYALIDLLIMDKEEALKISGQQNLKKAVDYFIAQKSNGLIITQGPGPVLFYSTESFFSKTPISELPISEAVSAQLKKGIIKGDTTGCGDNFVGGVLASVANQIINNEKKMDIKDAVKWGIVSGGLACFYYGGVYKEDNTGQKFDIHQEYLNAYHNQVK